MIKYNNYFASELEKHAMAITQYQHPCTIQLGDVNNIDVSSNRFCQVDLLLAGSPCTSFSVAGKRDGFKAESGQLFYRFVDALKAIKPKYFLLENVKMSKENESIMVNAIRDVVGDTFKVHIVNSALKSGQNRVRMYITDFDFEIPKDKGIKLKDIIECGCVDREKSYCLDANYWKGGNLKTYFKKSRRQLVFGDGCKQVGVADLKGYDIIKRVYSVEGKSPALTTMQGGHREPKILCRPASITGRRLDSNGVRKDYDLSIPMTQTLEVSDKDKSRCLSTLTKDTVVSPMPVGRYPNAYEDNTLQWRKLTVKECCRLQTLPDDYCKAVSNSQGYKILGNGWTNEVIKFILKGENKNEK